MATNKLKLVAILGIILLATTYSTCKKNECLNVEYAFTLPIIAHPDLDSVNINDTIWFEVNQPVSMKDYITNSNIIFSGAVNLGTNIGFQEVLSATQFVSSAGLFKYYLVSGSETTNSDASLYRVYLLTEYNDNYILKLGVAPQKKGVFRILFGNPANVYTRNNTCAKANFTNNFVNTNQHFYLYPGSSGTPPGGGVYYFKVK